MLLIAFAGCGSPANPGNISLAAAAVPQPVAMKGEGRFFDGHLVATVSISRGFERVQRNADGRLKDQFEEIDLPDETDKDYAESVYKIQQLMIRGSPMPPVTLRLNLSNQSKEAVEIAILEVNSDLGNFAVQPDHLTVAAGQAAEPSPMNSQLGLIGDNFPVKVALRIGDKTENQVINVKSLFTPQGTRK